MTRPEIKAKLEAGQPFALHIRYRPIVLELIRAHGFGFATRKKTSKRINVNKIVEPVNTK